MGDARLCAFPAPTLDSTFAWATSALVLSRIARLARIACIDTVPAPPSEPGPSKALASRQGPFVLGNHELEPVPKATEHTAWAAWLSDNALPGEEVFAQFRTHLGENLVVVPEAVLVETTVEFAEIQARVQLTDRKAVANLWYEEHLPPETILVSYLKWVTEPSVAEAQAVRDLFGTSGESAVLNLGGDETVGKGLVWCKYVEGGEKR